jgi:predicted membrane-bound spermidine synthase
MTEKITHSPTYLYRLAAVNFVVGAIELTLELTATRIAAPYIGLTIYVWTSIIGVILASLAIGYVVGGSLADKRRSLHDIVYLLLISAILIGELNELKDPLLSFVGSQALSPQLSALLTSCLLFAPPTIVLGCIPPYLARLSIKNVASSGRSVARINAAGTLGALFGTFFTGFYLFALAGTRNILSILVVLLVVTSLCLPGSRRAQLRLLLTASAIFLLVSPSTLELPGRNKDLDTAYSRYIIRDLGKVRALQSDATTWQSAIYVKNHTPFASYALLFSDVAKLPPQHQSYLVIGGGAFTVPDLLQHRRPPAQVTVVDVDYDLLPLSERYFGLTPGHNLHIVTTDGRQYLNTTHSAFDLIYMDAFSDATPPFQLTTTQAVQKLAAALNKGGIVAVNLLASPQGPSKTYVASMAKTYESSFAYVAMFRVDKQVDAHDPQNILLLASQQPFQSKLAALSRTSPIFRNTTQQGLHYAKSDGFVLRDDFAPVEQMVAADN